jgi:hypothetical protein
MISVLCQALSQPSDKAHWPGMCKILSSILINAKKKKELLPVEELMALTSVYPLIKPSLTYPVLVF